MATAKTPAAVAKSGLATEAPLVDELDELVLGVLALGVAELALLVPRIVFRLLSLEELAGLPTSTSELLEPEVLVLPVALELKLFELDMLALCI
ncbi:hypothetical protein PRIC2_013476 [Phytophthora ramorum]